MTQDRIDSSRHHFDRLLHRYVDGEMGGGDRTAVESVLAGDDEALADVRSFQDQNILMQALHPPRSEDAMLPPAALNLARGLRRQRAIHRGLAASVALLALLGAGAAGWQAQGYLDRTGRGTPVVEVFPPNAAPVAAAGDSEGEASTTSSAASAAPTMSPVPTAAGTLAGDTPGWLGEDARRVPVHPPNLQTVGFQLVDGRADLTAYGPVIRFAYTPSEGGESPRLALTVASFGADRQSLATTINPQHASLFWQTGPLLYALSGDVAPGRLLSVAEAIGPVETKPGEPAAEPATASPAEGQGGDGPSLEVTPVSDQNEPSKEL
jgi:anti-sigma factor RsiW